MRLIDERLRSAMGNDRKRSARDAVRETLTLDYKKSAALARDKAAEISKDVSAFANSAGGTIIYGMEEKDKSGYPTCIDGGIDPRVISADWLNDIISSNIRPAISGMRINEVSLHSTFPGRVAYIVYVPQSDPSLRSVGIRCASLHREITS